MALEHNAYLGRDDLGKLLCSFSLPCILSLLVSALYNIVDQIFIGNSELGTWATPPRGWSSPC